ncbi:hypothetical protein [Campylobacter gastrosuis]|uniref:Uncharacterized protein n=1 Tax=Campylobacter gastrosuis TaxID=2974576 RepID=A0ABT7HMQ8_9BACT|nr:hypothetical protein [Campylobacter gastrosuis]MDL0087903.1 hypothetical protein [Campylobacter gastrosuis]MDL0088114.1 hypothetical protein [Campylobacter gastrosuis]
MQTLNEAKRKLTMLKVWLVVIIDAFIGVIIWAVDKFEISENILISLVFCLLIILLLIFIFLVKKANNIIKEIGKI